MHVDPTSECVTRAIRKTPRSADAHARRAASQKSRFTRFRATGVCGKPPNNERKEKERDMDVRIRGLGNPHWLGYAPDGSTREELKDEESVE